MTSISLLVAGGDARALDQDQFLARLEQGRFALPQPFSEERLEFASTVGAKLMANRAKFTDAPGIAHFGYWTRRAELRRLQESFQQNLPPDTVAQARGLVFHLPPRNVETVFLYSWIISFLAGNANVVRLPSELSANMRDALEYYIDALEQHGDNSQSFVHYPADSDVNAHVSSGSDARIVWGGDVKVLQFSRFPLRDGGKALWFGDRISASVADGASLGTAGADALERLAEGFATDIFVFDQMACSSPHVLYIVGDPEHHGASVTSLVSAIARTAERRGFVVETGHAIRKMVKAFEAVASNTADDVDLSNKTLTVLRSAIALKMPIRVGGGFLQLCYLPSLAALRELVTERHQTLTYFGFTQAELGQLFPLPTPLGLTRIVPIGEALNFDSVWDGYDLCRELTRLIRIR